MERRSCMKIFLLRSLLRLGLCSTCLFRGSFVNLELRTMFLLLHRLNTFLSFTRHSGLPVVQERGVELLHPVTLMSADIKGVGQSCTERQIGAFGSWIFPSYDGATFFGWCESWTWGDSWLYLHWTMSFWGSGLQVFRWSYEWKFADTTFGFTCYSRWLGSTAYL